MTWEIRDMADLKTPFLVAKLALFNVRVLQSIEQKRGSNGDLDTNIERLASDFGLASPVSLLNQSTFLGVVYLSLVWLWDQPGVQRDDKLLEAVDARVALVDSVKVVENRLHRPVNGKSILRALRNATAHGRITVYDGHFDFTDINPREKDDVDDVIVLRLSWEATGRIAEGVFWALNDKLWPGSLEETEVVPKESIDS